jgi:hypothetical protein
MFSAPPGRTTVRSCRRDSFEQWRDPRGATRKRSLPVYPWPRRHLHERHTRAWLYNEVIGYERTDHSLKARLLTFWKRVTKELFLPGEQPSQRALTSSYFARRRCKSRSTAVLRRPGRSGSCPRPARRVRRASPTRFPDLERSVLRSVATSMSQCARPASGSAFLPWRPAPLGATAPSCASQRGQI